MNCIRLLPLPVLLAFPLPAFAGEVAPPATETPVVVEGDDEGDSSSDDDDDAPRDSVRAEREAVKSGSGTDDATAEASPAKKRVIKTIQKKNFMKVGRYEAGPSVGFVSNDPFLNRYIVGGVFDYHVSEIFAVEAQLGYSPILGEGPEDPDLKPLSKQLLNNNRVSADISKITAHGSVGLAFSPIYGKAAVGSKIIAFDVYTHFGGGFTMTQDDLEALNADSTSVEALNTANQTHPTTVFGGGARVAFNKSLAARLEVKSMSYVEVINSNSLEMKNYAIVQGNVSFFFPGMD
jgi:outer membrane beta-barrel protein